MNTIALKQLRNLYLTRTMVQLLWAAVIIRSASTNFALGAALMIAYPLWDVACTLYDLKRASSQSSTSTLIVNVIAGVLTAIGIGLTAFNHPAYAVAIFGAWALAAGLLQLAVGILRRKTSGGQWPMILSGAQSGIAGVSFILGGLHEKLHYKDIGGYAIFGAAYFALSAIFLSRSIQRELAQQ
ncbi:hypothetical protein ACFQBQ_04005 [Granulicella cerasi]|uniref:DUF308 domain-containing protein n=1 Tax=Granulicella cerasi TaxID=741063 RepID=A0ABW1Z9C1_9BACT|nr:hypothetical protein [Granulicella cerasi]